ncbi:MAG: hypothetical protein QG567_847 [Campylobacterota bacterium]|nr:hypothetical protein [Campylobacterota bacterium]
MKIEDLVKKIDRGFSNKNGYTFDFETEVLEDLDAQILTHPNDSEKLILFFDNKSASLPKKVTMDWIAKKIDSREEYNNLSSLFNMLPLHGNCYPTTYGVGYFCLFKNNEEFLKDRDLVDSQLKHIGLKYKCEFSDAHYVLRFIISKEAENLAKIRDFLDKTSPVALMAASAPNVGPKRLADEIEKLSAPKEFQSRDLV